jgi:hypothetical protein
LKNVATICCDSLLLFDKLVKNLFKMQDGSDLPRLPIALPEGTTDFFPTVSGSSASVNPSQYLLYLISLSGIFIPFMACVLALDLH